MEDEAAGAELRLFPVTASAVSTHSPRALPSFTQPGICLLAHCARQDRGSARHRQPIHLRSARGFSDLKQVHRWGLLKFKCAGDICWATHTHTCTHTRAQSQVVQINTGIFHSCSCKCIFLLSRFKEADRNRLIRAQYCLMTRDVFFERIPPPTFFSLEAGLTLTCRCCLCLWSEAMDAAQQMEMLNAFRNY